MLQNTTHFNQDDFRALNFMSGLEKTHGTIKLKHVERDFHIVYDPMKPSKTHIVLGEMRMVKRKMTPRPKDPIKIKIRSKKRYWTPHDEMEFIIPLSQIRNPRVFDFSVGVDPAKPGGDRSHILNCKMIPMEGRPCKKKTK